MRAYLANGLFSESEQLYNQLIGEKVRKAFPDIQLYIPQENEAINDKNGYASSIQIFEGDNAHLDCADVLIAVLDGVEIDSGVSAEIGRFATLIEYDEIIGRDKKRFIIGVYTDSRQKGVSNSQKIEALQTKVAENQFSYRNLYTIGAVKKYGVVVASSEELIDSLKAFN